MVSQRYHRTTASPSCTDHIRGFASGSAPASSKWLSIDPKKRSWPGARRNPNSSTILVRNDIAEFDGDHWSTESIRSMDEHISARDSHGALSGHGTAHLRHPSGTPTGRASTPLGQLPVATMNVPFLAPTPRRRFARSQSSSWFVVTVHARWIGRRA